MNYNYTPSVIYSGDNVVCMVCSNRFKKHDVSLKLNCCETDVHYYCIMDYFKRFIKCDRCHKRIKRKLFSLQ